MIQGLKESVEEFEQVIEGATAQDVMNLVLMTQYFDTLKEIGGSSKSNVVLVPSSPDGFKTIASQIQEAMIVADKVRNDKDID